MTTGTLSCGCNITATVTLDGKDPHTTPHIYYNVSTGEHRLVFASLGYINKVYQPTVIANQIITVRATLDPIFTTVPTQIPTSTPHTIPTSNPTNPPLIINPSSTPPLIGGGVYITKQAQNYTSIKSPMTKVYSSADGFYYIHTPTGTGNNSGGYAAYALNITVEGIYKVVAKTKGFNSYTDSFSVQFGNGPVEQWNIDQSGQWVWSDIARPGSSGQVTKKVYLTSGTFNVKIFHREEQSRLAELVITNDLNYMPGPSTPTPTSTPSPTQTPTPTNCTSIYNTYKPQIPHLEQLLNQYDTNNNRYFSKEEVVVVVQDYYANKITLLEYHAINAYYVANCQIPSASGPTPTPTSTPTCPTPNASFTYSVTSSSVARTIKLNGYGSSGGSGHNVTEYKWYVDNVYRGYGINRDVIVDFNSHQLKLRVKNDCGKYAYSTKTLPSVSQPTPTSTPSPTQTPTPTNCTSLYNTYKAVIPNLEQLLNQYDQSNNRYISKEETTTALKDYYANKITYTEYQAIYLYYNGECQIPYYSGPTPTSTPSQVGKIACSCNVSATVTLDGSNSHSTPYTYSNVSKGSHDIKFTKSGYHDRSYKPYVSAGSTATVYCTLAQISTPTPTPTSTPTNCTALYNTHKAKIPNLEQLLNQYDISNNRYMEKSEVVLAQQDYFANKITSTEYWAINGYYTSQCQIPYYSGPTQQPTLYPTATPTPYHTPTPSPTTLPTPSPTALPTPTQQPSNSYQNWVDNHGGPNGLRHNLPALLDIIDGFMKFKNIGFTVLLQNLLTTLDYYLGF